MSIAFNQPNGAYVYETDEGSPAAMALEIGDVIIRLNDTAIDTWANVSVFMANAPAGSQLTIHRLNKPSVTVILAASELNASRGYIGVYGTDYWEPKPGWEWIPGGPMYAFHMQYTLRWCFIILFSVALFNLMPIPALDGDKLLSNGLGLVISDEKKVENIMWVARIAAIVIIVISIVLSLITGKGLF
jgi:membrane-associated protease RseP (regulator of RpoE activity)